MANVTLKVNGSNIDLAALSAEKQAALAAIFGEGVKVEVATSKKKEVNRLQMKEGSETIAIDKFSGEEFDITQLSDEELANAKKTGLSPVSYSKYEEGQKIRDLLKSTKVGTPRVRNAVSAAQQVKDAIKANASKVDDKVLATLVNADESKKLFGLHYPLLLEIPEGASDAEKKEMRKVNGNYRFASVVWNFNNKAFFMTNDIYSRNVDRLVDYFNKLSEI